MGDYISLEELVTLMVRGDLISSAVINRMWNIVAGEVRAYVDTTVYHVDHSLHDCTPLLCRHQDMHRTKSTMH